MTGILLNPRTGRPITEIEVPSHDSEQRRLISNWVRDEDDPNAPLIDMERYGQLLTVLPDHIVEKLEKGRLAHDGKYPMLKAGLGYEEMLSSVIVDGTAIASSSAEARLAPAVVLPRNFMAISGNLPGRTLRVQARGRVTTLTTAATMTFRFRIAATDIITGTVLCASGGIIQDAVAVQTNTQWEAECHIVNRSVGSTGTVFAQGDSDMASKKVGTAAENSALFMGSAGAATPAAVTYDTTIDQYLQFTGQWSLATAYSIQMHQYIIEALN
jgi:hypothetical protein